MPTKEQIWEKVKELGSALGVAAEEVWKVLVRQEFAVNGLIHAAFGLLFCYGSYRLLVLSTTLAGVLAVLAVAFGVLGGVLGLLWVKAGASRAVNPAYYVLLNIGRIFHIGEK